MTVRVLGSIIQDQIDSVPHLPVPGETVIATSTATHPGGKGANQAAAAAAWSGDAAMIGMIGDDASGRALLSTLRTRGLDVSQVEVSPRLPTGSAHICVDPKGRNMIVVSAGANMAITPELAAKAGPMAGDVCLAQLEVPIAAVAALFSHARKVGAKTILNFAPVDLAAQSLLPLTDVLVVNQTELAALAGCAEPQDGPAAEPVARSLLSSGPACVIVTLGPAGVLVVEPNSAMELAGHPATTIDTTGAGDCFCGVFACGLDQRLSPVAAADVANRAAALSTEYAGAICPPDLVERARARGFL